MQELDSLWESVSALLANKHSSSAIRLWFEESCILSLDDDTAVIQVFNEFKKNIIEKRFMDSLADSFQSVIGYPIEIKLQLKQQPQKPSGKIPVSYMSDNYRLDESIDSMKFHPGNEYTFDNFIVGSSNKFAHAACLAVANRYASGTNADEEYFQKQYNPLFIYGPSGLGKTHLLYAIMNRISELCPEAKIVYVKGEDFTNQLIDSISHGTCEQFRSKYRTADVLLIDDTQFISGKVSTQEEFFHTFNTLYENHKQIVLTCDCPPRSIKTLENRLQTRFEWGLTADIQPPAYELRIAIMKSKAEALGISLPADVLEFLANNLRSNVRQLEGAVKKLGAQSFLTGAQITVDLAISCVADLMTGSEPASVTVDRILEKVSQKYGVSVEDIKGRKRTKEIALVRHRSIYIIRKLTDLSLPAIGKLFGRDHTTIMASLDTVEREMAKDSLLELEMNDLIRELRG